MTAVQDRVDDLAEVLRSADESNRNATVRTECSLLYEEWVDCSQCAGNFDESKVFVHRRTVRGGHGRRSGAGRLRRGSRSRQDVRWSEAQRISPDTTV